MEKYAAGTCSQCGAKDVMTKIARTTGKLHIAPPGQACTYDIVDAPVCEECYKRDNPS